MDDFRCAMPGAIPPRPHCQQQCPSCKTLWGEPTANPKEIAAAREEKPPLDLLEYPADREIARALATGAAKYGRKNFRHGGAINASVYGGAIRRHIGEWLNGEDDDTDSGLSHLAHVGACIHVLFASIEAGTFVDDRGPQPPTLPVV